jgi:hypothetical protein
VVVDGVEGRGYGALQKGSFARDGKRLAYRAQRGDDRFVVVDGEEGPPFAAVGPPVFSPTGERLAYLAAPRQLAAPPAVVYASRLGKLTEKLPHPSAEAAYVIESTDRKAPWWFLVVDGTTVGPPAKVTLGPAFDPTGARVGHLAGDHAAMGVYLDGEMRFDLFARIRTGLAAFERGRQEPSWAAHLGSLESREVVASADVSRLALHYRTRVDVGGTVWICPRVSTIEVSGAEAGSWRDGPLHAPAKVIGP